MLKPALRIPLLLALVSALLTPGVVGAQGILLLAHGGRDDWNRQVLELASQVDSTLPVEVARSAWRRSARFRTRWTG